MKETNATCGQTLPYMCTCHVITLPLLNMSEIREIQELIRVNAKRSRDDAGFVQVIADVGLTCPRLDLVLPPPFQPSQCLHHSSTARWTISADRRRILCATTRRARPPRIVMCTTATTSKKERFPFQRTRRTVASLYDILHSPRRATPARSVSMETLLSACRERVSHLSQEGQ